MISTADTVSGCCCSQFLDHFVLPLSVGFLVVSGKPSAQLRVKSLLYIRLECKAAKQQWDNEGNN
jgi:hypothetical protein